MKTHYRIYWAMLFICTCFTCYIFVSEAKLKYRIDKVKNDTAIVPTNINKSTSEIYVSKADVDRYLSSNFVVSSYNWTAMLLGVATLVVTLLGWFLWINIIDTKDVKKELEILKDKLIQEREFFIEEKKKLLEELRIDYKDTHEQTYKVLNELQIKDKKLGLDLIYLKNRGIVEDEYNISFLENLGSLLKIKNRSIFFKGRFLSQLYSPYKETRLNAAFQCGNYCTSEDINILLKAYDFETDEDVKQRISDSVELISRKKNN